MKKRMRHLRIAFLLFHIEMPMKNSSIQPAEFEVDEVEDWATSVPKFPLNYFGSTFGSARL